MIAGMTIGNELRKPNPRNRLGAARAGRVGRVGVVELAVSDADRLVDALRLAREPKRAIVAPRPALIGMASKSVLLPGGSKLASSIGSLVSNEQRGYCMSAVAAGT